MKTDKKVAQSMIEEEYYIDFRPLFQNAKASSWKSCYPLNLVEMTKCLQDEGKKEFKSIQDEAESILRLPLTAEQKANHDGLIAILENNLEAFDSERKEQLKNLIGKIKSNKKLQNINDVSGQIFLATLISLKNTNERGVMKNSLPKEVITKITDMMVESFLVKDDGEFEFTIENEVTTRLNFVEETKYIIAEKQKEILNTIDVATKKELRNEIDVLEKKLLVRGFFDYIEKNRALSNFPTFLDNFLQFLIQERFFKTKDVAYNNFFSFLSAVANCIGGMNDRIGVYLDGFSFYGKVVDALKSRFFIDFPDFMDSFYSGTQSVHSDGIFGDIVLGYGGNNAHLNNFNPNTWMHYKNTYTGNWLKVSLSYFLRDSYLQFVETLNYNFLNKNEGLKDFFSAMINADLNVAQSNPGIIERLTIIPSRFVELYSEAKDSFTIVNEITEKYGSKEAFVDFVIDEYAEKIVHSVYLSKNFDEKVGIALSEFASNLRNKEELLKYYNEDKAGKTLIEISYEKFVNAFNLGFDDLPRNIKNKIEFVSKPSILSNLLDRSALKNIQTGEMKQQDINDLVQDIETSMSDKYSDNAYIGRLFRNTLVDVELSKIRENFAILDIFLTTAGDIFITSGEFYDRFAIFCKPRPSNKETWKLQLLPIEKIRAILQQNVNINSYTKVERKIKAEEFQLTEIEDGRFEIHTRKSSMDIKFQFQLTDEMWRDAGNIDSMNKIILMVENAKYRREIERKQGFKVQNMEDFFREVKINLNDTPLDAKTIMEGKVMKIFFDAKNLLSHTEGLHLMNLLFIKMEIIFGAGEVININNMLIKLTRYGEYTTALRLFLSDVITINANNKIGYQFAQKFTNTDNIEDAALKDFIKAKDYPFAIKGLGKLPPEKIANILVENPDIISDCIYSSNLVESKKFSEKIVSILISFGDPKNMNIKALSSLVNVFVFKENIYLIKNIKNEFANFINKVSNEVFRLDFSNPEIIKDNLFSGDFFRDYELLTNIQENTIIQIFEPAKVAEIINNEWQNTEKYDFTNLRKNYFALYQSLSLLRGASEENFLLKYKHDFFLKLLSNLPPKDFPDTVLLLPNIHHYTIIDGVKDAALIRSYAIDYLRKNIDKINFESVMGNKNFDIFKMKQYAEDVYNTYVNVIVKEIIIKIGQGDDHYDIFSRFGENFYKQFLTEYVINKSNYDKFIKMFRINFINFSINPLYDKYTDVAINVILNRAGVKTGMEDMLDPRNMLNNADTVEHFFRRIENSNVFLQNEREVVKFVLNYYYMYNISENIRLYCQELLLKTDFALSIAFDFIDDFNFKVMFTESIIKKLKSVGLDASNIKEIDGGNLVLSGVEENCITFKLKVGANKETAYIQKESVALIENLNIENSKNYVKKISAFYKSLFIKLNPLLTTRVWLNFLQSDESESEERKKLKLLSKEDVDSFLNSHAQTISERDLNLIYEKEPKFYFQILGQYSLEKYGTSFISLRFGTFDVVAKALSMENIIIQSSLNNKEFYDDVIKKIISSGKEFYLQVIKKIKNESILDLLNKINNKDANIFEKFIYYEIIKKYPLKILGILKNYSKEQLIQNSEHVLEVFKFHTSLNMSDILRKEYGSLRNAMQNPFEVVTEKLLNYKVEYKKKNVLDASNKVAIYDYTEMELSNSKSQRVRWSSVAEYLPSEFPNFCNTRQNIGRKPLAVIHCVEPDDEITRRTTEEYLKKKQLGEINTEELNSRNSKQKSVGDKVFGGAAKGLILANLLPTIILNIREENPTGLFKLAGVMGSSVVLERLAQKVALSFVPTGRIANVLASSVGNFIFDGVVVGDIVHSLKVLNNDTTSQNEKEKQMISVLINGISITVDIAALILAIGGITPAMPIATIVGLSLGIAQNIISATYDVNQLNEIVILDAKSKFYEVMRVAIGLEMSESTLDSQKISEALTEYLNGFLKKNEMIEILSRNSILAFTLPTDITLYKKYTNCLIKIPFLLHHEHMLHKNLIRKEFYSTDHVLKMPKKSNIQIGAKSNKIHTLFQREWIDTSCGQGKNTHNCKRPADLPDGSIITQLQTNNLWLNEICVQLLNNKNLELEQKAYNTTLPYTVESCSGKKGKLTNILIVDQNSYYNKLSEEANIADKKESKCFNSAIYQNPYNLRDFQFVITAGVEENTVKTFLPGVLHVTNNNLNTDQIPKIKILKGANNITIFEPLSAMRGTIWYAKEIVLDFKNTDLDELSIFAFPNKKGEICADIFFTEQGKQYPLNVKEGNIVSIIGSRKKDKLTYTDTKRNNGILPKFSINLLGQGNEFNINSNNPCNEVQIYANPNDVITLQGGMQEFPLIYLVQNLLKGQRVKIIADIKINMTSSNRLLNVFLPELLNQFTGKLTRTNIQTSARMVFGSNEEVYEFDYTTQYGGNVKLTYPKNNLVSTVFHFIGGEYVTPLELNMYERMQNAKISNANIKKFQKFIATFPPKQNESFDDFKQRLSAFQSKNNDMIFVCVGTFNKIEVFVYTNSKLNYLPIEPLNNEIYIIAKQGGALELKKDKNYIIELPKNETLNVDFRKINENDTTIKAYTIDTSVKCELIDKNSNVISSFILQGWFKNKNENLSFSRYGKQRTKIEFTKIDNSNLLKLIENIDFESISVNFNQDTKTIIKTSSLDADLIIKTMLTLIDFNSITNSLINFATNNNDFYVVGLDKNQDLILYCIHNFNNIVKHKEQNPEYNIQFNIANTAHTLSEMIIEYNKHNNISDALKSTLANFITVYSPSDFDADDIIIPHNFGIEKTLGILDLKNWLLMNYEFLHSNANPTFKTIKDLSLTLLQKETKEEKTVTFAGCISNLPEHNRCQIILEFSKFAIELFNSNTQNMTEHERHIVTQLSNYAIYHFQEVNLSSPNTIENKNVLIKAIENQVELIYEEFYEGTSHICIQTANNTLKLPNGVNVVLEVEGKFVDLSSNTKSFLQMSQNLSTFLNDTNPYLVSSLKIGHHYSKGIFPTILGKEEEELPLLKILFPTERQNHISSQKGVHTSIPIIFGGGLIGGTLGYLLARKNHDYQSLRNDLLLFKRVSIPFGILVGCITGYSFDEVYKKMIKKEAPEVPKSLEDDIFDDAFDEIDISNNNSNDTNYDFVDSWYEAEKNDTSKLEYQLPYTAKDAMEEFNSLVNDISKLPYNGDNHKLQPDNIKSESSSISENPINKISRLLSNLFRFYLSDQTSLQDNRNEEINTEKHLDLSNNKNSITPKLPNNNHSMPFYKNARIDFYTEGLEGVAKIISELPKNIDQELLNDPKTGEDIIIISATYPNNKYTEYRVEVEFPGFKYKETLKSPNNKFEVPELKIEFALKYPPTREEKKFYREIMKKTHPDRNKGHNATNEALNLNNLFQSLEKCENGDNMCYYNVMHKKFKGEEINNNFKGNKTSGGIIFRKTLSDSFFEMEDVAFHSFVNAFKHQFFAKSFIFLLPDGNMKNIFSIFTKYLSSFVFNNVAGSANFISDSVQILSRNLQNYAIKNWIKEHLLKGYFEDGLVPAQKTRKLEKIYRKYIALFSNCEYLESDLMARTLMKDLDDGYTEKNFFTESEQNEIVEKIYNEHYQKYKINFHNFNEFADCNKLLEKIYHSSNLFVNCVVYLPHTMSLYYFGSAKMYSECCKIMATLASSKLGVLAVDKIFKALEYVISNKYKFLKPNIENRIHNSMDKGLVTDLKEAFDSISAIILPVIKGIGYATDAGSEMLNKALNKTKNTLNHTFNAASECVANNGLAGFVSNIHSDEESKTMRNICKDVKSIANIASYPIRQVTSFINR